MKSLNSWILPSLTAQRKKAGTGVHSYKDDITEGIYHAQLKKFLDSNV